MALVVARERADEDAVGAPELGPEEGRLVPAQVPLDEVVDRVRVHDALHEAEDRLDELVPVERPVRGPDAVEKVLGLGRDDVDLREGHAQQLEPVVHRRPHEDLGDREQARRVEPGREKWGFIITSPL